MKYGYIIVAFGSFSKLRTPYFSFRNLCSKVPLQPTHTLQKKVRPDEVKVDTNTIALLERLSLVKTDPKEGVEILEDSIAFASQILHINTDNVQPLYSVLEESTLNLRSDEVTQGHCQKDIMKNALISEDNYFVAPIGNIPLHEVEVEENPTKAEENEI